MTYTLWLLLIAALVGICCALAGSLLVLRKMAMLGDAISHTVLLGIVVMYLITSQLTGLWMLVGATAVGVGTALLTQVLNRLHVKTDAAIGVTFTSLFALAVVLLTVFAERVHLDLDHVLYGEIAYAPLDVLQWNGMTWGPRAVWILAAVLGLLLIFISVWFNALKLLCFDEAFAFALGIPVVWLHYAVMTLVSMTAVAAFDLVGSILVVAMLVVPPATALLLARGLKSQLVLSALFAVAAGVLGYALAVWLDASISGAMAVCAGILFIVVFLVRLGQRRFVPGR